MTAPSGSQPLKPVLRIPSGCENEIGRGTLGLVGYFDADNEDEHGRLPHEARGLTLQQFIDELNAGSVSADETPPTAAVSRSGRCGVCETRWAAQDGVCDVCRQAAAPGRPLTAAVQRQRRVRASQTCPTCSGPKSRGADRCRGCYAKQLRGSDERRDPDTGTLTRTLPEDAFLCRAGGPRCTGRKQPRAGSCWNCYVDSGSHHGRKHHKRLAGVNVKIDELTLKRARALYGAGMSMRSVAAEILSDTEYKNAKSAASSLYEMFRARGWELRDQSSATAQANRDRGYRPQCDKVPQAGKNKGKRCQRRAVGEPVDGKSYCHRHHPDRIAQGIARLRQQDAVPSR